MKGSLRLAGSFLQGARRWFALAILCTEGTALTNLILPQIVRTTVDSVLGEEPWKLPAPVAEWSGEVGCAAFLR